MVDVLACRVCLATDVKLYYMYDYGLKSAYESLTGFYVSYTDRLPQHLCVFCSTLLTKYLNFKSRCQRSQELLQNGLKDDKYVLITTEYIHTIDKTSCQISLPYITQIINNETEVSETIDTTIKIEEPYESDILVKDEEITIASDEEPLSKKIKKKKKLKNQTSKDIKYENDVHNTNFDEFDDNFDVELVETDDFDSLTEKNTDITVLSKEEQLEEVVTRKNSFNYQNWFYKCDKCYKGFITDVTFKNHMIRHDPSSGPEICEICQTRWPDARALRSHAVRSHERRYSCRLCDHSCKSANKAKEHLKWHSGHKFVCKICGTCFAKSTTYLTHLRLRHPSEHECRSCGKRFISQNGLSMHAKKSHCGEQKLNISSQHKCVLCSFEFKSVDALNKHMASYPENGICNSDLSACGDCGDSFPNQELLKEHQKTRHHIQVEVRCEECNKTFAHDRSFALHYKRVHLGVKNKCKGPDERQASVVCEICGQKCFSKARLVYHQRTHTGEKPYQCNECPKRFSAYQRLKIHIRTHTGERPFNCQECPKAFKHKAALNRHVRVHTGAKPYTCNHCGKSFSQSNSMKLHVATVHLKIPAPYKNRRSNKLHE